MSITKVQSIQGHGLASPLSGTAVRTRGVVTGHTRKGFFLQDPAPDGELQGSCALFVFSPREKLPVGASVEVAGRVVDFALSPEERPSTQIEADELRVLDAVGPSISPVWLTADRLPSDTRRLAQVLNHLAGMLVGLEAGATFIAPSNPFGDYVVAPPDIEAPRTRHGGVVIEPTNPERWFPSFRIRDYRHAPQIHVGARLLSPVIGPLHYRASSFQVCAEGPLDFQPAHIEVESTRLAPAAGHCTVLTLNGFNLDRWRERAAHVKNPGRDVDDDVGDGRFQALARAIVEQAGAPDIVALQEIQDNDGAEETQVVSASQTYEKLIAAVRGHGGPRYAWADVAPTTGEDGGQPGGNIRNGFLYDPKRAALLPDSLHRLGETDAAYEDSRKPLVATFRILPGGAQLTVVNVHLASKRNQHGVFAPERPGHDPRLPVRVAQAEIVRRELLRLREANSDYYVTGDFNDFEFSETLQAMAGGESVNLVDTLALDERFDYNHRGKLQVLMHGLVSREMAARGAAEYEILHGNELLGVKPGELGDKPTDHAYVIARLRVGGASEASIPSA